MSHPFMPPRLVSLQGVRTAHLYALKFEDGVIKIGATKNPRERILAIERVRRVRVEQFAVHPLWDGADLYAEERRALSRASATADRVVGREFFYGLPFGEAVSAICAATPGPSAEKRNELPLLDCEEVLAARDLKAVLAASNIQELSRLTGINAKTLYRIKSKPRYSTSVRNAELITAAIKATRRS
jgi:hypothetical protein